MSLTLFGLTFNLYGLILGVSILLAYQASGRYARRLGVSDKTIESLFWWVVLGGVIGARAYHVIDKWKEIYSLDPISIVYLWNGGLAIWGAIMGGVVVASVWYYFFGRKNIEFTRLLDLLFFGLPLGQAVGRLGNFFNQELYGKQTTLPWGIKIDGLPGRYHPLFAYEAFLNLGLFFVLVKLSYNKKRGVVSGAYLIGYGLIRLILEQFRPDEVVWRLTGIPVAVIFSCIAILTGLYLAKASLTTSSIDSAK